MSTPQIQDRLRRKHMIVTGHPDRTMNFDAAGLRTLTPLHRNISIQGTNWNFEHDRQLTTASDHSIRGRHGTLPVTVTGQASDLLDNARSDGKILNALDFPMWKDSQWDRCSYASDMVAWDYLHGEAYCGTGTTPYPTGHVRWGLVGTAHAVSMLHIDSDGFATFVQVMSGKKLWAVYRPTPTLPLSSTNVYMFPDHFQLDQIPPKSGFSLEAVVLRPGDLLYCHFSFSLLSTYPSTV